VLRPSEAQVMHTGICTVCTSESLSLYTRVSKGKHAGCECQRTDGLYQERGEKATYSEGC